MFYFDLCRKDRKNIYTCPTLFKIFFKKTHSIAKIFVPIQKLSAEATCK